LHASGGANEEDEELQRALAASMECVKQSDQLGSKDKDTVMDKEEERTSKPTYPPLPEAPKGDRNLLCRVGLRLPDGRRVQRNFLRTDPVQVKIISILICFESCFFLAQTPWNLVFQFSVEFAFS